MNQKSRTPCGSSLLNLDMSCLFETAEPKSIAMNGLKKTSVIQLLVLLQVKRPVAQWKGEVWDE